jgi:hypothetical protein
VFLASVDKLPGGVELVERARRGHERIRLLYQRGNYLVLVGFGNMVFLKNINALSKCRSGVPKVSGAGNDRTFGTLNFSEDHPELMAWVGKSAGCCLCLGVEVACFVI